MMALLQQPLLLLFLATAWLSCPQAFSFSPPAALLSPPAAPPVEVYMKGENITGFNPAQDRRNYYCFRIPQLLSLPSGRILAFAEGRADGCRPDGNVNRPIVVRPSTDMGKSWGPIGIAGPAMPHSGTNYPGAFIRDNRTIAMRYSTGHGVLETTSTDEGATWSSPANASQPPGGNITCGSAWPKMVGGDIIISCARGYTGRSTNGGRSWMLSSEPVPLTTAVTGLGESMMVVADGRSHDSLTMMIRAGSHNGMINHAIAKSSDRGDTWGSPVLLPILGTTW